MTKVRKKASQKLGHGKRYSDEVKARVGAFVNQINSEKGHGGISAAARKFGGSPLSISNWVKGEKGNGSGASGKAGSREGRGQDKVLPELTALNQTIAKRRRKLDILEARFDELKATRWFWDGAAGWKSNLASLRSLVDPWDRTEG